MMPPKVTGLLVCFCIAGPICAAQSTALDRSPNWSREVLPDLSRTNLGIPPSLDDGSRAGVTFLDHELLVVYAIEPTGQLSSRKTPEISSAFRLSLSLLDAKSGDLALTKEWGTRRRNSAVQVTAGGVLVKTGGIVKLYSPDFAQSRDLPLALDPNGTYFTSVSASGHTIAVSHYFKKEQNWISHIDVFDAATLKTRSSWDQYPPIFHLSMSDESFATTGIGNGLISLTQFGSRRSKIVSAVDALKRGCAAGGAGPAMLSDELILLRHCNELLLLNVDGSSSSLDAFNASSYVTGSASKCEPYFAWISSKTAKTVTTAKVSLVALSFPAVKVKKHLLTEPSVCLTGLQVAVYDLNRKQRVFTVEVDPLPKNDYDFAMSPDGSRLAVLNDRRVSVYSVPVPASNGGAAH